MACQDAGAQGPRGPVGPQGIAGSQGPIGRDGTSTGRGPVGPMGPQGPQGPIGQSVQGPRGARGPTGETGIQGSQGCRGQTGLNGLANWWERPNYPDPDPIQTKPLLLWNYTEDGLFVLTTDNTSPPVWVQVSAGAQTGATGLQGEAGPAGLNTNHKWPGDDSPNDIIGTSNLTWTGTPTYANGVDSSCFKLQDSAGTSLLTFPDFPISQGQSFNWAGNMYAENGNSFLHFQTSSDGTQDPTHGWSMIWDFSEGFVSVKVDDQAVATLIWGPGILPIGSWFSWKLTFDGNNKWRFYLNDLEQIPAWDTRAFNGLLASPHLQIENWNDFGTNYVLLDNFRFETTSLGSTGLHGATGVQGQTGLGLQGQTGLQGTTGISGGGTGLQGLTGVQGLQGETGAQGHTGLQGSQGDTGLIGTTGLQGPQGDTGIQGTAGDQGQTGVQGATGLQGPQGETGLGLQGQTGLQGETGAQGVTGAQGLTGIQGTTGTGVQGVTGLANFIETGTVVPLPSIDAPPVLLWSTESDALYFGSTGINWVQISAGSLQGPTGINGQTGLQGQTGLGITGLQGQTGLGITGLQGQTGLGITGLQGRTGLQGTTGLQGRTGIQGVTGSAATVYPRVTSSTTATTHTPNVSTTDIYNIRAQATDATIASPTGTPQDGQYLIFRIKDDGTSRDIEWSSIYRLVGTTLPLLTTANKVTYVGTMYNSDATKYDVLSGAQE